MMSQDPLNVGRLFDCQSTTRAVTDDVAAEILRHLTLICSLKTREKRILEALQRVQILAQD
eukprot:3859854-Rhodomonas_salina.2